MRRFSDGYAVTCPECGAIGPQSMFTTPTQAIDAWNQRADDEPLSRADEP